VNWDVASALVFPILLLCAFKKCLCFVKNGLYGFEVIVYFITGVFSVLVHNRCSALTVDGCSSLCYSQMLKPLCCSNNIL